MNKNKEVKILWIDDNISFVKNSKHILIGELKKIEISAKIDEYDRGIGVVERLKEGSYDLMILDIELEHDNYKSDAFQVIDKVNLEGLHIPTVLLSSYINDDGADNLIDQRFRDCYQGHNNSFIKAFSKESQIDQHFSGIINFIQNLVEHGPITIVTLSDLHFGQLLKNSNEDVFLNDIEQEFSYVAKRFRPNYLCIAGDFSYTSQSEDLAIASRFIKKSKYALQLKDYSSIHFCPGNHDLDRNSPETWKPYYMFIKSLSDSDNTFPTRFATYNPTIKNFAEFKSSDDILSVESGSDQSVVFAALNSVVQDVPVPGIGVEQWKNLETMLSRYPRNAKQPRIALFHHHIFPAPLENLAKDQVLLSNQARAIRELNNHGFQLIIHGHSHYSCINSFKTTVINTVKSVQASEMVVYSPGAFGGYPSSATPVRQYSIIKIGFFDPIKKSRTFSVATRLFDYEDRKWKDGDAIDPGEYFLR